jgi:hypothetical protein
MLVGRLRGVKRSGREHFGNVCKGWRAFRTGRQEDIAEGVEHRKERQAYRNHPHRTTSRPMTSLNTITPASMLASSKSFWAIILVRALGCGIGWMNQA